jgi:hypothetical protein
MLGLYAILKLPQNNGWNKRNTMLILEYLVEIVVVVYDGVNGANAVALSTVNASIGIKMRFAIPDAQGLSRANSYTM